MICYGSRSDDEEDDMHLDGLHHITMITADAHQNVAFYADLLGLRLVRKTVNPRTAQRQEVRA
jgi:hypothetical protein